MAKRIEEARQRGIDTLSSMYSEGVQAQRPRTRITVTYSVTHTFDCDSPNGLAYHRELHAFEDSLLENEMIGSFSKASEVREER